MTCIQPYSHEYQQSVQEVVYTVASRWMWYIYYHHRLLSITHLLILFSYILFHYALRKLQLFLDRQYGKMNQFRYIIMLLSRQPSIKNFVSRPLTYGVYLPSVDNSTIVVPADGARKQKIWESTITVVGIVLCGVIILATVAFVCHHRVTNKRKREKRAHAHDALLTNGGMPNSPSHSGSGLGSPNASYADPLGSPTKGGSPVKRDYVKPHTPTSLSGVSRGSDGSRARKHHPAGMAAGVGPGPGGREVAYGPSRMSSQSSISAAASMHTSPLPQPIRHGPSRLLTRPGHV